MNAQPKKLLDQIRDLIRVKHYSIRTEEAYVSWARRYILFHDKRHPREMGTPEIAGCVASAPSSPIWPWTGTSPPPRRIRLCVPRCFYIVRYLMDPGSVDAVRAKKPKRLPTVLTREEVRMVIAAISGTNQLSAKLLYGSGLRLMECLRLRVKDVDFA